MSDVEAMGGSDAVEADPIRRVLLKEFNDAEQIALAGELYDEEMKIHGQVGIEALGRIREQVIRSEAPTARPLSGEPGPLDKRGEVRGAVDRMFGRQYVSGRYKVMDGVVDQVSIPKPPKVPTGTDKTR